MSTYCFIISRCYKIKVYESDASRFAYRLLPEGTTFAKPIQLVFKYDSQDLKTTAEDFITVAWQQADGTWKAVQITKWPAAEASAEGNFSGPVYLNDGACGSREKWLEVKFSIVRGIYYK